LEQEGDGLAREVIDRVANLRRPPRGLAGGGAQLLSQALDDVLDEVEEFGVRLVGFGIEAPLEQALEYLSLLKAAVAELAGAVREVRAGRTPKAAQEAIEQLEHTGDGLERQALFSLYAEGIDPLLALRWTDLLSHLERALDRCRRAVQLLGGLAGGRRS